jgi:hypothetical protein
MQYICAATSVFFRDSRLQQKEGDTWHSSLLPDVWESEAVALLIRVYTKTDCWKNRFSIPVFPKKKKPVKIGFRIFTKNVIKKWNDICTYFKTCI